MNDALYIAATGMQAQQLNVDTIANNLANVNTVGFKKARVGFIDLVNRHLAASPAQSPTEPDLLGSGVAVTSVAKVFDVGDLRKTGSPLDVAIQGDGFLEVVLSDGSRAFSRGGTLKVSTDGLLTDEAGHVLRPGITVPANATAIVIQPDGRVQLAVPGRQGSVDAGQLELVRFANPGALAAADANTYAATEASGEATPAHAGEDGVGTLAQGALEGSNVKLVDEMVNLMVAQRAYEASVKVVQASDEMQGLINSLRK